MTTHLKLLLLLLSISAGLGACALKPLAGGPVAHNVTVGIDRYVIRQITESTWTASASDSQKMLEVNAGSTAALRQAVEKVSGCKVTDSDYSRQGKQFDAQVICDGLTN